MHLANDSPSAIRVRCCWAVSGGARLPFGSRWLHAVWASLNLLGLAFDTATTWGFGIPPLLSGSGKLGTPWDRMHPAKPTNPFGVVVAEVVNEATFATPGEP